MSEQEQGETIQLVKGPVRIAIGPMNPPGIINVSDIIKMDEGEDQYSTLPPWHDLGFSPSGATLTIGKKRLLAVYLSMNCDLAYLGGYIERGLGGPHHQPAPHAVVILYKAENEPVVARLFGTAVLKKAAIPRGLGESGVAPLVWEVAVHRTLLPEW